MAPSTTIRRLLKEVAELSSDTANPNPAFHAAPVSDSNLHEWHFTLLGPPSPSPYAGGVYHGRISLPAQYPLKPPNFRFLTASGRFEVNREICLSISGFHEETWMPAWGVRTALTALRSFMAESGTAGQVGGLEANDEVRKRLAVESKSWKCAECGKTNTAVMEEWWAVCRGKGVKVDEEGMGLEALPAGMAVEAIDRSRPKGQSEGSQPASTPTSQTEADIQRDSTIAKSIHQASEETKIDGTKLDGNEQPDTPATLPVAQSQNRLTPTPTIPAQLSKPQSPNQQHSGSSPSIASTPAAPSPGPTPQLPSQLRSQTLVQSQPQTQTQTQTQTQAQAQAQAQSITLDRAITVVFLALCIMILKKIFYSSQYDPARGAAGSREDWEMGLRREY